MSLLERVDRAGPSFADSLADHGSRLAVATGSTTLTYAELAARVDTVADALGEARRLVLLTGADELDALVGYLAALRGGHAVLLAAPDSPSHLDRLIDAFDPDVLLTEHTGWQIDERRPGSAHDLHPELALLLSTSGTTGSPRVVRLSRRNLQSNATAIAEYLELTPADRAVTSLPMHYCYGLSVINSHLATGAGLVLTDCSVVDRCFWRAFRRHGVTGLAGVPHTFDLLDRVGFDTMSLPSLRYVTQAGGRLAPERVQQYAALGERAGWDLFVMYGQTEATARMAYLPPHLAAAHPTTVGIPVPRGSFELEPLEGCASGEGELVYRGDNVMLGYADGPDDLALGATIDELRTGDIARRTPAGLYEIVGRRSRIAKIFGLRIDLDHVERLLLERSIDATCTTDDHRLIVAVTDAAHADAARAVLVAECGLPAVRLVVEHVAELPRLANGKPDHLAIAAAVTAAATRATESVALDHTADVDPGVLHAFAAVFPRPEITGDATFVDLGGDSLSYVEVSLALEDCLGELPADWHTTPLRELEPATGPKRRLRQMETSVVLRAVSIVLVVGTHIKLFNVLGGAHLLLGVAGYNFARFHGQPSDRIRSIARIAVPSMVWLAVASTMNPRIHLPHVLLLNGWLGGDDAHGGYWYVEAIVQILVPLALLLSVPAVRRLDRSHRCVVPLTVLAAGLLVRFHVVHLPTVEPHDIRPHDIFWIFALGWVAAEARATTARVAVSALVAATVPGYFGEPAREVFVVSGILLLIWLPTVRLPRSATRVVGSVAAASLYTYLTHWQVFPPLRDAFGPVVALVGSILAGVALWTLIRFATQRAGRARQAVGSRSGTSAAPTTGSVSPLAAPL